MFRVLLLILAVLSLSIPTASHAFQLAQLESETKEELLLFFEEEELVIATLRPTTVRKAPAIATVITAKEIRNMGARNIIDILERLPGFGITRMNFSLWEIEVRGLKTSRSEKIKLMIDGHTMNYPVWGGAAWAYDSISLDQVKRIEIIRGPGSALYGSNAFTGVINVVTQQGEDIDGATVSLGAGTFEAGKFNIAYGKKHNDLDILAFATFKDMNSANLNVESDLGGFSGRTDDWGQSRDLGLKLTWEDLTLNTRYMKRENGPYIGVQFFLNDESEIKTEQYMLDLSYEKKINDRFTFNITTYMNHLDMDLAWEIYPEGVPLSLGFPDWGPNDSMFGTPSMKNRRYGLEANITYNLTEKNLLTVGAVYEKVKHYDLGYYGNFHPLTFASLGTVQDISSLGMWSDPAKRRIRALYVQDEWGINEDLSLTAGIRYDEYDDFGDTTNPRIGLVWKVDPRLDIKLLYGEAFRAPNFEELYLINNPATLSNPDLSPEKIRTYEVGLGWYPLEGAVINLTGFYNTVEDRIELVAIGGGLSEFQNRGKTTIYGIETEAKYSWERNRIYANHTWQRPEDDELGSRLPDVPSHRFNIGMDREIGKHTSGNLHLLYVGKRPRASSDAREDLEEYATVNSSITIKNIFKTLELQGSVYNLFDQQYFYPSPPNTVQSDYPAAGRSFFVEARYKF